MLFEPEAKIDSILIVEPQARIRATLEVALRQGAYRTLVDDGSHAFAMVEDEVPDVVLLSCHCRQGGTDSFAICKRMVSDNIAAVIILTSSNPTKEMVIKAVRAGAKNFVVTPAGGSVFCQKLERTYSQTPQAESRAKFPIVRFGPRDLSHGQKVDIIMRDVATVRVVPHAVAKILQITMRDETGAQDVAKAAGSDPSIAAMILKRANSSYYGGDEPVADIQSAVVRMGFRECRDQVIGMTTANLFPRNEKSFGFNRVWYWIHSLACAMLAEYISRRASFENKNNAFTAGLLHDLGKIVLDDFLTGPYGQVVRKSHTLGITMREAEYALLERDHALVGSTVAANWRFPGCVCETIANHHQHADIIEPGSPSLTGAIFLANHMTKAMLIGSAGDFIIPNIPTSVWASYGCDRMSLPALLALLYDQLCEFCAFLQISEKQTDVALDHDCDSGVAVLYDPKDRNRLLLALFLVNQGFQVNTLSNTDSIPTLDDAPQLAVVWPTDPGEAIVICDMIESHTKGPWPTICIVEQRELEEQIQSGRGWLRAVSTPLDCFTLLVKARELVPDILKAKIIAHGDHKLELVTTA